MPDPYEPCSCRSGKKYKFCHGRMDKVDILARYGVAQQIYSENWLDTANYHQEAGYYDWMADKLRPFAPARILDIGCGTGQGLVALCKLFGNDLSVLATDENPWCLDAAEGVLASNNVKATVLKRVTTELQPAGYRQTSTPINPSLVERCMLIESDVLNDEHLLPLLNALPKFDAVTIWLTGHHVLRGQNVAVLAEGIRNEGDHRLIVQNTVYELADVVLREGGVLQVVDRVQEVASDELRDEWIESHRDQASPTTLEVRSETFSSISYLPPPNNRTALVWTPGTKAPPQMPTSMSIASIISVKS